MADATEDVTADAISVVKTVDAMADVTADVTAVTESIYEATTISKALIEPTLFAATRATTVSPATVAMM